MGNLETSHTKDDNKMNSSLGRKSLKTSPIVVLQAHGRNNTTDINKHVEVHDGSEATKG